MFPFFFRSSSMVDRSRTPRSQPKHPRSSHSSSSWTRASVSLPVRAEKRCRIELSDMRSLAFRMGALVGSGRLLLHARHGDAALAHELRRRESFVGSLDRCEQRVLVVG